MKQSENITELLSALTEIQSELVPMAKSSQGYGYKYTDLDTITQAIKPILHKHNVGYLQSVGSENGVATLTTRVFSKGEWLEDTAVLPIISSVKNNAAQTLGMSITYMRRYMLSAMLGITSDEDIDASNFVQNQQNNSTSAPQSKPATKNTKQQKPPAQKAELKGGESTEEEKARIKELCTAKYENGSPIFTQEEMRLYSSYRKEKTATELIEFIENALRNRRADAPELANKTADEAQGFDLY